MSPIFTAWNMYNRDCLIAQSKALHTHLDDIFEHLEELDIGLDTMLNPNDSPRTPPTTNSATHIQSLSPAMHAVMAKKHLRFHKNTRFHHYPTQTHTYDSKYEGCSGCQADAEILRQVVSREDPSSYPFLSPKYIYDKTIKEAAMQHNAKYPHNTVKKELDI
jgi:hypothetical protein